MKTKEFLVDTNILIDASRKFESAVSFLDSLPRICISTITAAELYQGCRNKRELKAVEKLLENCQIVPITTTISDFALELVYQFFLSRKLVIDDALIVATAVENNLVLVTRDTKHFTQLPVLKTHKPY